MSTFHPTDAGRRFHAARPETSAGRRSLELVAAGLAVVVSAVLLSLADLRFEVGPASLVGLLALAGLVAVIVGGAFAVVAIVRRGERSLFVFATLLPWAMSVFLLIGELAVQH